MRPDHGGNILPIRVADAPEDQPNNRKGRPKAAFEMMQPFDFRSVCLTTQEGGNFDLLILLGFRFDRCGLCLTRRKCGLLTRRPLGFLFA